MKICVSFKANSDTIIKHTPLGMLITALEKKAINFLIFMRLVTCPIPAVRGVKDIFYMARSARVPLGSFKFSSENRRVAKKFDDKLTRESRPLKSFDIYDKNFIGFCSDYFLKRHGPLMMPEERLKTILNHGLITDIVSYSTSGKLVACVLEVSDKNMTHFWYSFYDISLIYQSLGMWLMLDSARHAKDTGKKYFYAGTVSERVVDLMDDWKRKIDIF